MNRKMKKRKLRATSERKREKKAVWINCVKTNKSWNVTKRKKWDWKPSTGTKPTSHMQENSLIKWSSEKHWQWLINYYYGFFSPSSTLFSSLSLYVMFVVGISIAVAAAAAAAAIQHFIVYYLFSLFARLIFVFSLCTFSLHRRLIAVNFVFYHFLSFVGALSSCMHCLTHVSHKQKFWDLFRFVCECWLQNVTYTFNTVRTFIKRTAPLHTIIHTYDGTRASA